MQIKQVLENCRVDGEAEREKYTERLLRKQRTEQLVTAAMRHEVIVYGSEFISCFHACLHPTITHTHKAKSTESGLIQSL